MSSPGLTFASVAALLICNSWLSAVAGENGLSFPTQTDGQIVLPMQSDPGNSQRAEYLQIFVGDPSACCTGRKPVAGHYSFDDERGVVFEPAFDFAEGQTYTVETKTGGRHEFTIQPAKRESSAEVVSIYPSGDEIPENTLRFYIHFPVPVKPQVSSHYVELRDASGFVDDAAFMHFRQELWSEDRRRLTLLLDPGRIKRGVAQNLALGPALKAGNQYAIVVKSGWPVADGTRSLPRAEKRFRVSEPLNTLPDISTWHAEVPRIFTRDRLVLQLDRPFDFELVRRAIRVLDAAGTLVSGEVLTGNGEQLWQFQPHNVWTTKDIQVLVDTRLEDVAGNNFNELLDRPLHTKINSTDQKMFKLTLRRKGAGA